MNGIVADLERYFVLFLGALDGITNWLVRGVVDDSAAFLPIIAFFVVPLALTIFSRRYVASLSILGAMLLLAGVAAVVQPRSMLEGRLYFFAFCTAFLVALGCALDMVHARLAHSRLSERTLDLDEALVATQLQLDQERLWRRAGGDDRARLDDDEIQALVEKLSERKRAKQTGGPIRKGLRRKQSWCLGNADRPSRLWTNQAASCLKVPPSH